LVGIRQFITIERDRAAQTVNSELMMIHWQMAIASSEKSCEKNGLNTGNRSSMH
jgi:hypothetical protein